MGAAARRRWAPTRQAPPAANPRLKLVKPVEDPAVEEELVRKLVAELVAIRIEKGETFSRPKTRHQPWRVLDELDVMLSRGEITEPLYRAGRNYGDRYKEGHAKGVYYSSLRANTRSSTGDQYDEFIVKRMTIFVKRQRERQIALAGNRKIIALCDAILGDDCRVDAGREARKPFVEAMVWALTRLAYHYGYMW